MFDNQENNNSTLISGNEETKEDKTEDMKVKKQKCV